MLRHPGIYLLMNLKFGKKHLWRLCEVNEQPETKGRIYEEERTITHYNHSCWIFLQHASNGTRDKY